MRIAGVTRVSSEGQTRDDRYGLMEQQEDIQQKVLSLGRSLDEIVWYSYQESATDAGNRPQFQGVLSEIVQLRDAGALDLVVFGRPDRLGRDGEAYFFSYLTTLEGHGKATVRFGRNDADPNDANRNILLFLNAFKAAADASTIKENTRRGRLARARVAGKLPQGSREMLGYTYNAETGRREIDLATNPILRGIGEGIISGWGLRESRRWAKDQGYSISVTGLSRLLHNPAIIGKTVSTWVNEDGSVTEIPLPDATPPTFTEEEFDSIQERLREIARWGKKQKKHYYPLSGAEIVRCGGCGIHFCGATKGTRRWVWRNYRHKKETDCNNPYKDWPAQKLESLVWDRLLDYFSDPEEAKRRLSEQVGDGRVAQVLEIELGQLAMQGTAAQERKTKLTQAWARGRIEEEAYEKDIIAIEEQEARWEKRRKEIQATLRDLRALDLDRISDVIDELAAEDSNFSHWRLFPGNEDQQEEIGDYLTGPFRYDDGTAYYGVDPDSPAGRIMWERRRGLMQQLGVKAQVYGRDMQLSMEVPTVCGVAESTK